MKPHRVIIYVGRASHWLQDAEACGSLICRPLGKPLTVHLRRAAGCIIPRGESKPDRVRCSRSTLPSPEETTANHRRAGSSARRERIMMSTPAIYQRIPHQCQSLLSLYDFWGVRHRYRQGTHVLRLRGQGHGLEIPSRWQILPKSGKVVKKEMLTFCFPGDQQERKIYGELNN